MSETTPRTPLQVAKEAVACYALGDTPGMVALFAPDGFSRLPGNPTILPWAGTFVGPELSIFHERAKDALDMLEFTVSAYEAHGETVIFYARERCRVKVTGKVYLNDMVGILTIHEGRVTRYLEYSDTAAMQDAFAP